MSVMSRRFFCRRSLEFTYHLADGAVGILLRVDDNRDEYVKAMKRSQLNNSIEKIVGLINEAAKKKGKETS